MSASVEKRLIAVKSAISSGAFEIAAKQLALCSKRGKPNPKQRVTISEYWTWLGDDLRSLKILGPLKTPFELESLEDDLLIMELRKAYLLGMSGARYLGLQLFEQISLLLTKPLEDIYPQAFQNRGYLHLSAGNYTNAREYFERARELYDPSEHQFFFITLGLHDCHIASGEYEAAAKTLEALHLPKEETSLQAIYSQVLGENLQYRGKLTHAKSELENSLKLFGQNENKDCAYANKHLGITLLKMKDLKGALSNLLRAEIILRKNLATPMALQEVYFWIDQVDNEKLEQKQKVALYAHPSFGLLSSFLRGEVLTCPAHWMKEAITVKPSRKQDQRGLLISHKGTELADYTEVFKRGSFQSGYFLDLNSSLLFLDSNRPTLLDETSSLCLIATIGAGSLGVTESLLFDFIYRQKFTSFESAQDRLKKAIKKLLKIGFQIERKKNTYTYLGYKKELLIFLPFQKSQRTPLNYVAELYKGDFSNQDIKKSLNLSTRAAQRLSKEWYEAGLIKKRNPTSFFKNYD